MTVCTLKLFKKGVTVFGSLVWIALCAFQLRCTLIGSRETQMCLLVWFLSYLQYPFQASKALLWSGTHGAFEVMLMGAHDLCDTNH